MGLCSTVFFAFCNRFDSVCNVAHWRLKYRKEHRKHTFFVWKWCKSVDFFDWSERTVNNTTFDFKSFCVFSKFANNFCWCDNIFVWECYCRWTNKKFFKVLKKLKLSLTVHHQLLKKVLLQLKLKKSKLNLKKLELQLLLNNKVTTQVA